MSKSVGNVINPLDIINKNGADVFRLWVMVSDFKQDLRLGESNIKQVSEQYRKIRNTFRFLLGNINPADFDPKQDMIAYDNLEAADQYILVRLNEVVAEVRDNILKYDYVAVNKALMNFMVNELSSYYCDFTKDILYCSAAADTRRRQVQSVYWQCTDALVRMWAPFLCYTTEEVWQFFGSDEAESVHYLNLPEVKTYANAAEVKAQFETLLDVRSIVMKALEDARNENLIHSAQEAAVELSCTEADQELLDKGLGKDLAQWLIVSQASVRTADSRSAVVSKAAGTKCPRCWNYSEAADSEGLCPRCHAVMNG
jgi:isoleucyl-tRNA synthetase